MITLSFLQLLEDNGFGTLDEDLLWQKNTLGKIGIHISDVGDPVPRGTRDIQSYQLFARGADDIKGHKKLTEIRQFLKDSYSSVCELPAVPKHDVEAYGNVTLMKPSTITSVGYDENGRMIYSIQGSIIY